MFTQRARLHGESDTIDLGLSLNANTLSGVSVPYTSGPNSHIHSSAPTRTGGGKSKQRGPGGARVRARCAACSGRGKKKCTSCGGQGRDRCVTCQGAGGMRHWIAMTAEFNVVQDQIRLRDDDAQGESVASSSSSVPSEARKNAKSETIFAEMAEKLRPLEPIKIRRRFEEATIRISEAHSTSVETTKDEEMSLNVEKSKVLQTFTSAFAKSTEWWRKLASFNFGPNPRLEEKAVSPKMALVDWALSWPEENVYNCCKSKQTSREEATLATLIWEKTPCLASL